MNFDQNAHPQLIPAVLGFESAPGAFEVDIEGEFDASHYLYRYFPDGSDEPLHGHSWKVIVTLAREDGGVDSSGLSVDYLAARNRLDLMLERLEHVVINNLPEFKGINPTSENIARWFYCGLQSEAESAGGRIRRVRVFEGPRNSAAFEPAPQPPAQAAR